MSETRQIEEFGAVGDGKTLNTAAIQAAVDACAAAGGGRVVVPAGEFVSGPIFLRSHVEFHLAAGAVLRGSRNFDEYPTLDVAGCGYHIRNWWYASLLTGCGLEDVSVTGRGILDGQGEPWWRAKESGGDLWENREGPRQLKAIRPVLLYLFDCERVLVEGIKLLDSPMWTLVPIFCRNMIIRDVDIKNPWKPYHNCDGIDLVSCNNVRISGCHVDTGDDGICMKTVPDFGLVCGPNAAGRYGPDYSKPRIPCENVIVENCVVEHAHSGVGIWAEVIGGMSNVVVCNCVFDGTRTGIRINRYPWPGGYVKDVRINNIVMRRVESVFEVSSYLDPKKVEQGPGMEDTPEFCNIHFSNITATKSRFACEAYGLPKMPVRDISFSHIRIEADKGFDFRDARNILLDDVEVICPGPAVQTDRVQNMELRRLVASSLQPGIPVVQLANTEDTWIHGCKAGAGTDVFLGLVGDKNRNVVLDGNELSHVARARTETEPVPAWSFSSYAFSGSAMWRKSGHKNVFLPVTAPVMETIRKEWNADWLNCIHGVFRLESGGRSGIELEPGDRRRIYVIEAWSVAQKLIICEDGELLQKIDDPDWRAWEKT